MITTITTHFTHLFLPLFAQILLKDAPHVVSVLLVSVVPLLHVVDLILQRLVVQMKCSLIAFSYMEGNVFSLEYLSHVLLGLGHEESGYPALAVGAKYRQRGYVPMFRLGVI